MLAVVDGFDFDAMVRVPVDAPDGEAEVVARSQGHVPLTESAAFVPIEDGPAVDETPPAPSEPAPRPQGYRLAAADGGVFAFGAAAFHGALAQMSLAAPIIAVGSSPDHDGYWLAGGDGGVFAFGPAGFAGSRVGDDSCRDDWLGSISAFAPRPPFARDNTWGADGYWLATEAGYVFDFAAPSEGNATMVPSYQGPSGPVVAMAALPGGYDYWLLTREGGVFAFGEAGFHGSIAAARLAAPPVGLVSSPSGDGYWVVAADGGVFALGDARFHGSLTSTPLRAPIVGIASTNSGHSYWLASADGGVFAFGDARYLGGTANADLNAPIVGITT